MNERLGSNPNLLKWMTQTVQRIRSLKPKVHQIEIAQKKTKNVNEPQAERPIGIKLQTPKFLLSNFLVQKFVVRGSESHSCQEKFWTRWGRIFSWRIPLRQNTRVFDSKSVRSNFWNGWRKLSSKLDLWTQKFIKLKSRKWSQNFRRVPDKMAKRYNAPDSRISSVYNSGTRVCAWVRIPVLPEHVWDAMREILQLMKSPIL